MKTEHGVPIPRRAAVPRVAGYVAGATAWLTLIFEPVPHRPVVVSVAAGLAIVLFGIAYRRMGETRQQTRVLRAALGYRRGERPWTWTEHFVHGTVPFSVGLALGSTLDGADARMLVVGGIILVWAAAVAVSALQKRRHERSDRERFGSPAAYEAARRFH
ncbi:hypothetical protein [Nocardioides zeae]|uniref:Kef-type K+ transport system membrane component KefB n=1 Tax=Nocardioides zeae TaxID=1457234 RepID=A0AAJ1U5B3_9ACTN|nr:hypothetical protein [Nocardioides zeae]MDQ1104756.1 Kef-type K+ transport system membrane component KefB [Nocardioides zeae]